MPETDCKPPRPMAEILREIDCALPLLSQEDQNLVAAFAQGLQIGLLLRAQTLPQIPLERG